MPLQKQPVSINFAQGLDLKTDPWQVNPGNFLKLENSVFNKGGLLQKRNGFKALPSLIEDADYLTTFKGNALAVGDGIQQLVNSNWIPKGNFKEVTLGAVPLVRTGTGQNTVDTAINNNLVVAVWEDTDGNGYYQVDDAVTGSVIVPQVALPATAPFIEPRVFSLGVYFIVTFLQQVSGTWGLYYIAIPAANPSSPLSPVLISTNLSTPSLGGGLDGLGYDGVILNGQMYIAYSATDGLRSTYIDSSLIQHFTQLQTGINPAIVSVAGDTISNTIWVTWWDNTTSHISSTVLNHTLLVQAAPVVVGLGDTINCLTSVVSSNLMYFFYEAINYYADGVTRTDIIKKGAATVSGPIITGFFSPEIILRASGLLSKAFYIGTSIYMLSTYSSQYQPTVFLIDSNGNIFSRFAISNGGGYVTTQVLSSVTVNNLTASVGYLYKDLITSVNKNPATTNVGGLYSQTGINMANLTIGGSQMMASAEVGGSLHLSGGMLWQFDGDKPVEHGFNVYPEDAEFQANGDTGPMSPILYNYQFTYEWTDAAGNIHRSAPSIPTVVDLTNSPYNQTFSLSAPAGIGSNLLTVVSLTNLFVGQFIHDFTTPGSIAGNTYITAINTGTNQITLNQPITGNIPTTDQLQTQDLYSIDLKIPTLRLTYKDTAGVTPYSVRIGIYRWSTNSPVFYQITPYAQMPLNDPTVDYITVTDSAYDYKIQGNSILYTNGGVLENIAAPAMTDVTIFKSRLFGIDGEDQNLLWYSKPVIQATPVEMTDLQTIYISPTISSQGTTGVNKCIFPMDDKLVLFKESAVYYLTGNGPDITGANNDYGDPVFITATVGCSNPNSIVFMPSGLMFQSDKGIWLLGRDLQTSYIGSPVETLVQGNVILSAITIPDTNQVRFTLSSGITIMYDYFYNQWGTFKGIPGNSSCVYQGLHTYIDQYNRTFQENVGSYVDGANPVLMSFTTSWLKLTGLQGYQRAYFFYLLGEYYSPHTLLCQMAYDYNPNPLQQTTIYPVNFNGTYGSDPIYGDGSPYGGNSQVEQWRVFLDKQRCQSIQITLNELYDPSLGVAAGAGLTLSGINMVIGTKKGYPVLQPSLSVG